MQDRQFHSCLNCVPVTGSPEAHTKLDCVTQVEIPSGTKPYRTTSFVTLVTKVTLQRHYQHTISNNSGDQSASTLRTFLYHRRRRKANYHNWLIVIRSLSINYNMQRTALYSKKKMCSISLSCTLWGGTKPGHFELLLLPLRHITINVHSMIIALSNYLAATKPGSQIDEKTLHEYYNIIYLIVTVKTNLVVFMCVCECM